MKETPSFIITATEVIPLPTITLRLPRRYTQNTSIFIFVKKFCILAKYDDFTKWKGIDREELYLKRSMLLVTSWNVATIFSILN